MVSITIIMNKKYSIDTVGDVIIDVEKIWIMLLVWNFLLIKQLH